MKILTCKSTPTICISIVSCGSGESNETIPSLIGLEFAEIEQPLVVRRNQAIRQSGNPAVTVQENYIFQNFQDQMWSTRRAESNGAPNLAEISNPALVDYGRHIARGLVIEKFKTCIHPFDIGINRTGRARGIEWYHFRCNLWTWTRENGKKPIFRHSCCDVFKFLSLAHYLCAPLGW